MTLLQINCLSHGYAARTPIGHAQRKPVLEDITLSIADGETLALLGRSGCGKSTLARLMTGLEAPLQGDVLFEGENIQRLSRLARQRFRRDIQMVFQDALSAVNPRKTVESILREPLRHLSGLPSAAQTARIHRMLDCVELSQTFLHKLPSQLSGGQLQRVCLARALVVQPRLLILDEAVSNLDLVLQARIITLLQQLREQLNIAFLFITHDLRLVNRFCQRVVVMDEGKIVESQQVNAQLHFSSSAGRALQQAVLPAFPVRSAI